MRNYFLPVIKAPHSAAAWSNPEKLPSGVTSETMAAVVASLDGKRPVSHIWGRLLSQGLSPDAILAGLECLDSLELIEEGDPAIQALSPVELDRFSSQMRVLAKSFPSPPAEEPVSEEVEGMKMQAALKSARVLIADEGEVATALARCLAVAGFGNVISAAAPTDDQSIGENTGAAVVANAASRKPALMIHCPDEFVEERCEELNRVCLKERIPMLPYRRVGLEVEIGPLIVPHETACYTCYARRRDAVLSPWERQHAAAHKDIGVFKVPLGLDFLVIETLKVVLARSEPVTQGRLLRLSFLGGLPELHAVLKLPRCPACGVHRVEPSRKLWEE